MVGLIDFSHDLKKESIQCHPNWGRIHILRIDALIRNRDRQLQQPNQFQLICADTPVSLEWNSLSSIEQCDHHPSFQSNPTSWKAYNILLHFHDWRKFCKHTHIYQTTPTRLLLITQFASRSFFFRGALLALDDDDRCKS